MLSPVRKTGKTNDQGQGGGDKRGEYLDVYRHGTSLCWSFRAFDASVVSAGEGGGLPVEGWGAYASSYVSATETMKVSVLGIGGVLRGQA